MTQEALKELLEAVEEAIQAGDWKVDGACDPDLAIRRAKQALAQPEQEPTNIERHEANVQKFLGAPQPEQEPVAWEQFYPDIGKPQIEQPKVRTGDCLLVGVCASEGHKIQAKQEPWRESASDYERGFIDGMQKQMQSSVDKAVNAMSQRTWVGLTSDEIANMFDDWPFKAGEFARAIEAKLKEKNGA